MTAPRATLRDVARLAECHYSTVSLALRNHPRITAATRERVHDAARQLGYSPDAMLTALAAYRTRRSPTSLHPTIAWLTNHHTHEGWRNYTPCNIDYFEGASARAAERGYKLEPFWLAEPGMTGRRMAEILRTRGIVGILLPPQERMCSIDFDWESFATITFGHTLLAPRLHLVANHEYRTMGLLFSKLKQRKYRDIGLVDLREHDARVDHNWLAAYLIEQHKLGDARKLPPLIFDRWNDDEFLRWVRLHQPEVIVTKLPEVVACLKRAGYAVPGDIGVAFHSLHERTEGLSGTKKNSFHIGVMAVDLLVDMLHRNERGSPANPHLVMIEGSWVEGETVRPEPAAESTDAELVAAASR
jgi:DNA-binding LacI/PurR family transcriptional regulator